MCSRVLLRELERGTSDWSTVLIVSTPSTEVEDGWMTTVDVIELLVITGVLKATELVVLTTDDMGMTGCFMASCLLNFWLFTKKIFNN